MDWVYQYRGLPWVDISETTPSFSTGFDCVSLIESIYLRILNIKLRDLASKITTTSLKEVKKAFKDDENYIEWTPVSQTNKKDFDIVLMSRKGELNHVGLLLRGGVLHSVQTLGVIYTPLEEVPSVLGFKVETYLRYSQCPQ